MRQHFIHEQGSSGDLLGALIREAGLDEPGTAFAGRLTQRVVQNYRRNNAVTYKKQERVGKYILLTLIALNILMVVKLNPLSKQPVLTMAIGGFILAFACLMVILNKNSKALSLIHSSNFSQGSQGMHSTPSKRS